MPAKRGTKPKDPVAKELDAIKRLLIVLLLKIGSSQGEVAKALRTDQANVSRMFSAREVKKLDLLGLFDEEFWKVVKRYLKR